MKKLKLHHRGELWNYALKHGYVVFTEKGIRYPGFQRVIEGRRIVQAGQEKPPANVRLFRRRRRKAVT